MNGWEKLIESRARRRAGVILIHSVFLACGYLVAQLLADDRPADTNGIAPVSRELLLWLALSVSISWALRIYETVWAFVGIGDLLTIARALTIASVLYSAVALLLPAAPSPASLALNWLISTVITCAVRLVVSARIERGARSSAVEGTPRSRRALIVGGGDSAASLLRENSHSLGFRYEIVGLVDDDPGKRARRIYGVEIVGAIEELPELVTKLQIDELLLAIPSVEPAVRRQIIAQCLTCGLPLKTVPTLPELMEGRSIAELTEIDPLDVLGRNPIELDTSALIEHIRGSRVMITGAGGSIGSELCRRVASMGPDLLILYERAESPLHSIAIELEEIFGETKLVSIVGDIKDKAKVEATIQSHRPEIIYHAAAYKHVHLMEAHPLEAIENNVLGTEVLAAAAAKHGVSNFVLISTDKAVRPIGIMGMTKRVAEDVLRSIPAGTTTFVAVRFGNVLGSVGSVLPLFQKQVSRRRPVTVTNPEATRYFMLTSEAGLLVMQAGCLGEHGDVLFLDMGSPVRIKDLAERVIMLSGLTPGLDVPVEIVGLRPGERMDEELVQESEELVRTEHPYVFKVRGENFAQERFNQELEELKHWVAMSDAERATKQLMKMVQSS